MNLFLALSPPGSAMAAAFNNGTTVTIPLSPLQTVPANDLVFISPDGKRQILNPEDAWYRQKDKHLDLSTLAPDSTTRLWTDSSTEKDFAQDETLPFQAREEILFSGSLISGSGRSVFNGSGANGQMFRVILAKNIHTYLLRKELLRRLGYKIPAMKWLSEVTVRFPSETVRDRFLKVDLTKSTDAAWTDWEIVDPKNRDPLLVHLKDVVVTASGSDTNLAMAPPLEVFTGTTQIVPLKQRILRSLALPYAIANLGESLNQFEGNVGRVESSQISFAVSDIENFNCGYDDALWMMRKISEISPDEWKILVKRTALPEPIAELLTQKLMARSRHLLSLFHLQGKSDLQSEVRYTSSGSEIKKGKVLLKKWPGYVSQFAFGDKQSPLHDLHHYLYSVVESNLVANLVNEANQAIPKLDYKNSIQTYLKTGELQVVPNGTWVSPFANGSFNLSRNLVIGNYLGTNNLVSLADNFGFTLKAGLNVGTDGLPAFLSAGASIQGSVSINYTHLKPLGVKLKQAITEPLKNEIVPYLFGKGSRLLSDLASLKDGPLATDPAKLNKAILDDFEPLTRIIGIGESLIITETLNGDETLNVSVQAPTYISLQAKVTGEAQQLVISRTQFFRKDSSTLQVYSDQGQLSSLGLSFEIGISHTASLFPVLTITGKTAKGSAESKVYRVNINPDPAKNPDLFANALGLSSALKLGSTHILEASVKPAIIQSVFRDKSGYFRFFHHVNRSLKTRSTMNITLPNGKQDDFITFNDGKQKGSHWQKLGNDVFNFLLTELNHDPPWSFETVGPLNPGQSFLGHSQSRNANFQGRLATDGLKDPFVQIQYLWQGWNKKAADAQAFVNSLGNKYGFHLYSEHTFDNLKSVQMYQISLYLNLYPSALNSLAAMTEAEQDEIESKYRARFHCVLNVSPSCAAVHRFQKAFADYHADDQGDEDRAHALLRMASNLESFAEFNDFLKAIGGSTHLYLYSTVDGFRNGSELPSRNPIRSSTLGKAETPYPDGILSAVESILDVSDGEFYLQWLREVL